MAVRVFGCLVLTRFRLSYMLEPVERPLNLRLTLIEHILVFSQSKSEQKLHFCNNMRKLVTLNSGRQALQVSAEIWTLIFPNLVSQFHFHILISLF